MISFIFSMENFTAVHKNLIQASEEAGVTRFIPSEWAHDVEKYSFTLLHPHSLILTLILSFSRINFWYRYPNVAKLYEGKREVRAILENSKLEYTLVANGLFMDYLLSKGGKKFLRDVVIPVDVESGTASRLTIIVLCVILTFAQLFQVTEMRR